MGGGTKSEYLNALTADATGKEICIGSAEATALGNLAVQMAATPYQYAGQDCCHMPGAGIHVQS